MSARSSLPSSVSGAAAAKSAKQRNSKRRGEASSPGMANVGETRAESSNASNKRRRSDLQRGNERHRTDRKLGRLNVDDDDEDEANRLEQSLTASLFGSSTSARNRAAATPFGTARGGASNASYPRDVDRGGAFEAHPIPGGSATSRRPRGGASPAATTKTGREEWADDDLFVIDGGQGSESEAEPRAAPSDGESEAEESADLSDAAEVRAEQNGDRLYDENNHDEGDDTLEDSDGSGAGHVSEEELMEPNATRSARRRPAWSDEHTRKLRVALVGSRARAADGSLLGTRRLRKLRKNQDEVDVGGVEYEQRLRDMFEKLHPRPQWASLSLRAQRRALAEEAGEQAATSSVSALARLLSQDDGLLRSDAPRRAAANARGVPSRPRPRLRPGTIEVERLRDANESLRRTATGYEDVSSAAMGAGLSADAGAGKAGPPPPAAIEALEFNPTARTSILMCASRDRRLRLFQIDGNANPLLETVHFPSLPIRTALFHPSGTSALLSGPRPYLYSYDLVSGRATRSSPWRVGGSGGGVASDGLPSGERDLSHARFSRADGGGLVAIGGRNGAVHVLGWSKGGHGSGGGSSSSSLLGTVRMNSAFAGSAWSSRRERTLLTLSRAGELYVWDVRNMRCDVVRTDTGLFGARGLEVSPADVAASTLGGGGGGGGAALGDEAGGGGYAGEWAVVGSDSGVVNVYDGGDALVSSPRWDGSDKTTPTTTGGALTWEASKSLSNLRTATTSLRFSHDGQLLAVASRNKRDALRLVHFPTATVYANWPTSNTPLGHVAAVAFAPNHAIGGGGGGGGGGGDVMAVGNSSGRVLLYSLGKR